MTERTKHDTGPLYTVVFGKETASWCDGTLTASTKELREAIEFAIRTRSEFRFHGMDVTAGDRTPLEIAAALAAFSPGRARFADLPREVVELLTAAHTDPSVFAGDLWAGGEA